MNTFMVSVLAFVAGVKDRLSSEKGATAVEYGLLVALIAAVIIGVVVVLGGQIDTAFQTVSDELAGAVVEEAP
ncbi:Flp family type IVb pilin [Arthrobacter sp. QXT-31]|uniref:Flp family type IVb pilin n=1 Tax=Arthrobacter sp. QXT-31 TaxID=1357915 RepID=UPI0009717687|nr:Flp family type IVb pilin [Arthrobacter sp. QXT-31]APX03147.1 pilus assembly protein [Arthrobacter sp. QXT-31]